jgi:hypothetical protein
VVVTELDVAAFMSSSHWQHWMEQLYVKMREERGMLCDCGPKKSTGWF